jgi:transglutaminase-like putative cysteine protease
MHAKTIFAVSAIFGLAVSWPLSVAAAAPPESFRYLLSDWVLEADGRAVQTVVLRIAVNNDAIAQREAQQSLSFADDLETVSLEEGYTLKPDGRQIRISPEMIRTQLAPGIPNLPQFGNFKQVVAIFPDVAGGDVISLTWRRIIQHPPFPGQFLTTSLFAPGIPWDDADVSISLPAGLLLNTQEFGPAHSEADQNGRHIHRWHWSSPARSDGRLGLSMLDEAPRIFASTFPDWQAFSRTYAAMVAPAATVTPRIQALADQVASGAATKREEAERLYTWVSHHVRWVAIYIGNGAFAPHPAEQVMINGYGDCKDQVTLLVALLAARGIASEPVLINLTPTYTISGPPTLSAFNHVIAYLPDWNIYADTTPGSAPFGILQRVEYGKPILHVTARGPAPSKMKLLAEGLSASHLKITLQMDPTGRITGQSRIDASGPDSIALRLQAAQTLAKGGGPSAGERLRALNETGTGMITPDPLDPVTPDYGIVARFTLDAQPGLLEGDGFMMPFGIRMLPAMGEALLTPPGVRDLPVTEPTPCYPGTQREEVTLVLPPGYRVAHLPKSRQIADPSFTYDSQWSSEGGSVRSERSLVSRIDQPLCEGRLRTAANAALAQIRRDYQTQIQLEKTAD